MAGGKLTYAVYRCYYGETWIRESIRSIRDYVDRIILYWSDRPWGNQLHFNYLGMTMPIPSGIDLVVEYALQLDVDCEHFHTETPFNSFTRVVNEHLLKHYEKPDRLILMEVDHVWRKDQIENALKSAKYPVCFTSSEVEIWRPPHVDEWYRIPARKRTGVVFWNMENLNELPETGTHGDVKGMGLLNAHVHNMGFAVGWEAMWWKHVIACSMSKEIGDSEPNEHWLDTVWMGWRPGMSHLEISIGHGDSINEVVPYPESELPDAVRE